MGYITKINFPYFLNLQNKDANGSSKQKQFVIFFGTNFFDTPIGWNKKRFIEKTNGMLEYIRRNFKEYTLLYQPHPGEKKEHAILDLRDFTVGEHVIAELFLYNNAHSIKYIFSACSGASISAFAMGFHSAVFLDTLHGAISHESMRAHRSYLAGLPPEFFIKSFDEPLPERKPLEKKTEERGLSDIKSAIGEGNKIWVIAADPALAMRASIIVREMRKENSHLMAILLLINHRRFDLITADKTVLGAFNEVIYLPEKRIWYSARPKKILAAIRTARSLKKLAILPEDTIISLTNLLFEENCILSYYHKSKKILIIENRWYDFVYNYGYKTLPEKDFHTSWGVCCFNYFVEPFLGLYKTIFREFQDGKIVSLFRYKKPLEEVYNATLVLMPDSILE